MSIRRLLSSRRASRRASGGPGIPSRREQTGGHDTEVTLPGHDTGSRYRGHDTGSRYRGHAHPGQEVPPHAPRGPAAPSGHEAIRPALASLPGPSSEAIPLSGPPSSQPSPRVPASASPAFPVSEEVGDRDSLTRVLSLTRVSGTALTHLCQGGPRRPPPAPWRRPSHPGPAPPPPPIIARRSRLSPGPPRRHLADTCG